jgi:hypothetical protein
VLLAMFLVPRVRRIPALAGEDLATS